jgi:hypothetical protein
MSRCDKQIVPQQQLAEGLQQRRTRPQVRDWLTVHAPGDVVWQNGAFLYSIEAMDPLAAGRKAGKILDRLLARMAALVTCSWPRAELTALSLLAGAFTCSNAVKVRQLTDVSCAAFHEDCIWLSPLWSKVGACLPPVLARAALGASPSPPWEIDD